MSNLAIGLIAIVVIMIAIPITLAWSGSRRRLRVGRTNGVLVLRMPRGHHAILAILALLPAVAISGLAFATTWAPGAESSGWILGGFFGLAGAIGGGYLLALEARGCLRLDDAAIVKVGAVGQARYAWADVTKVTFNPRHNWFFLTVAGGKLVYVVEGLNGIADFATLALERLPPAVLDANPDAAEALREVATL